MDDLETMSRKHVFHTVYVYVRVCVYVHMYVFRKAPEGRIT